MAASVPTTEPTRIRAGDSTSWTKSLSDYTPDDGWTLTYTFSDADVWRQVDATDNGDGSHLLTLSTTDTAALKPTEGPKRDVRWVAHVTKLTERVTVGTGQIPVLPDLSGGGVAYDDRSHVKKTLDLIKAVIEGSATRAALVDQAGDRSVQYKTDAELIVMLKQYERFYQHELREERIAQGLGTSRTVRTRL